MPRLARTVTALWEIYLISPAEECLVALSVEEECGQLELVTLRRGLVEHLVRIKGRVRARVRVSLQGGLIEHLRAW